LNFDADVNATVVKTFKNLASERVFDAWLNPELAKKWLFPDGSVTKVEINAKVGGRFTFTDHRDGQDIEHVGMYLEIDHPRRLVFTWATVHDLPDTDRVIVEIAKTPDGCELTLTHQVHPNWKDYTKHTENAWAKMLQAMETAL
jgi:uncharacterized protein YndB with AHSA1/START domain